MSEAEYKLGQHCGITFAGIKVASLFRVKTNELKTMFGIVKNFLKRGFGVKLFKVNETGALLYVYNEKKLSERLFDEENRQFLQQEGYDYISLTQAMTQLRERLNGGSFPHEIGVFLGYPLDDVKGFIENPYSGYKVIGYWKVYSNEEETTKMFERYKRCSASICNKMDNGRSLMEIFNLA